MAGAERVIAVERDERCLDALAEVAAHYPGQLDVVSGDAMETDFAALATNAQGEVRIVANLPYNIGTELLVRWLTPGGWPPFYASMTLMFQREVAQRIVASAGDKAYGRLGVLAGWRTEAKIAFDLPPQAFTPPPKVTSSVVHIVPRAAPLAVEPAKLAKITEAAFGQRRKMLRQSLKSLGGEALLARAASMPRAGQRRFRWRNSWRLQTTPERQFGSSARSPATKSNRPGRRSRRRRSASTMERTAEKAGSSCSLMTT